MCHRMKIRILDSPHPPLPLTPALTTPASYPRPSIAGKSSASSPSLSRAFASRASMCSPTLLLPSAGFELRQQPLPRPLDLLRLVYALRPFPRLYGLPVPLSPLRRVLG